MEKDMGRINAIVHQCLMEKRWDDAIRVVKENYDDEATRDLLLKTIEEKRRQQVVTAATNPNMTTCKYCGATVSKTAKSCPHCGGRFKKPVYKRWWFIVIMVVVVLGILGNLKSNGDKPAPIKPSADPKETAAIAAEVLIDCLDRGQRQMERILEVYDDDSYDYDNIVAYCDQAATFLTELYHEAESAENVESISEFYTAVHDYLANAAAYAIKTRDYLEDGDEDDREHAFVCLFADPVLFDDAVLKGEAFLAAAGFAESEIAEMMQSVKAEATTTP